MSYRTPGLILATALLIPAFVSCSSADRNGSEVKTQLGVSGNQVVAERYKQFVNADQHCLANGTGKRVLMTGFGLFTGVKYNISGVVVGSFADPKTTADAVSSDAASSPSFLPHAITASGVVSKTNKGAIVSNRSMTINGKPLEICFLTLDVQWDLAAAIIAHEAEGFHPAFILMTGRGGATANFEAGAFNRAMSLSGFQSNGAAHPDNTPQENYILSGGPAQSLMSWNPLELRLATQDLVQSIGYKVTNATAPRTDNTYICNNVSYVVLEAIKGAQLSLAGGYLKINPVITGSPKAGFFHFPDSARNDPEQVAVWVKVLSKIVDLSV